MRSVKYINLIYIYNVFITIKCMAKASSFVCSDGKLGNDFSKNVFFNSLKGILQMISCFLKVLTHTDTRNTHAPPSFDSSWTRCLHCNTFVYACMRVCMYECINVNFRMYIWVHGYTVFLYVPTKYMFVCMHKYQNVCIQFRLMEETGFLCCYQAHPSHSDDYFVSFLLRFTD